MASFLDLSVSATSAQKCPKSTRIQEPPLFSLCVCVCDKRGRRVPGSILGAFGDPRRHTEMKAYGTPGAICSDTLKGKQKDSWIRALSGILFTHF